MNDDSVSVPKQKQIDYDPSEDFFGLEVDLQPRNVNSGAPKPRSWFGPNGQYIRELPCPSCRGRGYTPCTECGIERSKLDCSQCNGKGIRTCRQCLGDCVIWEESIDERPWEKARSISPLKVKEDDEVDNLDIKLDVRKKSKRIYQSPPPEVGLKISRSLRSLNAKTGLFTKRMKILHRDPKLHAQRVAAIKKAKGTAAARKRASDALKAFFLDPENRRKRSISMKGAKFYCSNCGREGHRRHYCPELIKDGSLDRRFRCRLCGVRGHNRRTCHKSRSSQTKTGKTKRHRCRACGQSGHNRRTCPNGVGLKPIGDSKKGLLSSEGRTYTCSLCKGKGHNIRTCSRKNKDMLGD
ncbi:zinc finger protein [Macleaya cordata]|uniref:Zinc finger protein n=1 Tax=Macleaya cordata TaxID=56857 RepID=A0A200QS65_MACCD|nr:zinc finger protein [Macleaya cordata]